MADPGAPQQAVSTIEALLPEMLERLARAGDQHGLARAHLAAFWAKSQGAARMGEAGEQARLAAACARNAGDDGLRSRALGMYVVSLCYGPQDAAAIEQELMAVESEQAGPYVQALVALARGEAQRLNGHLGKCRQLMHTGLEQLHAMGIHTIPAAGQNYLAWAELTGGDPASAPPVYCKPTRDWQTSQARLPLDRSGDARPGLRASRRARTGTRRGEARRRACRRRRLTDGRSGRDRPRAPSTLRR